ncbi:MAG: DUF3306 domain-containing protein [Gammaproteobacteria bacterium]|nr:DUF3306 domain-containing protein [Gammaproteobacteria bacterium]NIR85367.1 DUF3306 domain-containing protein [Gammaproteobacteria bacterium]NIR88885.1 DUF3306 domain-containing protein [Gammaproteobacteria bacterium]NIU06493.1 DUF3306 domain-containing protein [Gammaproteobacteria bacterium]NIV53386.1 DUF3306 domain-containing protein [Gammaproteobacteria bacterium]
MTSRRNNRPPAADATPERGEESFVGRWLRRKRAAREGRPSASEAAEEGMGAPPATGVPADEARAQKTDADLPPLDSLDETSSYADFLSPRVSETLRRQALRKLFTSAKFNVVDGLDDYAEDYRAFHALGDVITSDMRYAMKREAEKAQSRSDSARPGEGEAEQPAEARGEHQADPGSAGAGDRRPQRAASEQREGEQGDETGSA